MIHHGLTNCGKWGLPPSTSGDMRDLYAQEELHRGSEKLCGQYSGKEGDVGSESQLLVGVEISRLHWFGSEGLGNRTCMFPDF